MHPYMKSQLMPERCRLPYPCMYSICLWNYCSGFHCARMVYSQGSPGRTQLQRAAGAFKLIKATVITSDVTCQATGEVGETISHQR